MFNKELLEALKDSDSLYLLDLSWHLHRSYHVFNFSVDISGFKRPTGHLYGVLETMELIRSVSPNSVIVITQDGVPVERNEEFSDVQGSYKEGRATLEFNFYADIPFVKAACCALPKVFWAYNEDKECDDLMYALAKQAQKEGFKGRVYVYSGDNDLLQAIDENTSVIRTKSKNCFNEITNETVMNEEPFVKKFRGVDVYHIANYRAIIGDSSDAIKGIPRFPRELAVKVAMSSDNISEGHKYKPENETERKWLALMCENMDTVSRNYRIMKLTDSFDVKVSKPKVNKDKLLKLLENFKLNRYRGYLCREVYNEGQE